MAAAVEIAPERYEGVEKTGIAFKMMASMGWAEGQGLGRSKQGIKKHLTVKKKIDNLGVGTVEADKKRQDWTLQMVNFNTVLGGLSEITSKHSGRRAGGDMESDSGSDSCASDASVDHGVAHPHEKRKASASGANQKKAKRAKASVEAEVRGELTRGKKEKKAKKGKKAVMEDAEEEPRPADSSARRSVSHLGRFKKREAAKQVRSYSSTDLAAILGTKEPADDPFAAFAGATSQSAQQRQAELEAEGSGSDSDSGASDSEPAPEATTSLSSGGGQPFDTSKDTSAWWASMFCRGGGLGSKRDNDADTKRGFSEADQENLYNDTQAGATTGKRGLGRANMPKKVAGVRFAGKKTKIADSDEEKAEAEARLTAAEEPAAAPSTSEGVGGAVKWKKIATKILREAGGSMKLKFLKKKAVAAAGLGKGGREAAEAQLMVRLHGSSVFVMDGKKVSIKSKD